jgi:hypothetical protein
MDDAEPQPTFTAFAGDRRLTAGDLVTVGLAAKAASEAGEKVLIFEDATARVRDLDLRGSESEVRERLAAGEAPAPVKRGPGRPKLGVSAREVTLLPRHWDWLAAQPGGASAALRRLVDEARRTGDGASRIRQGREAAYRFITTLAGNRPGYEEATRALFAGDGARFTAETQGWPKDVRDHAWTLAGEGLG